MVLCVSTFFPTTLESKTKMNDHLISLGQDDSYLTCTSYVNKSINHSSTSHQMFQNQYVDNISDTYASTTFKDKPSMEIHDAKTIQHHVESALQIWDLADAGDDGKLDLGPLLGPQNLVWGETSYP